MDQIQRPVGLMAFVLLLAIYLDLTWLAALVGAGAFFVILSTVNFSRPMPVAQAAPPQKEEEVLTPVVVQDTGEAPYLYPPDFRLKVRPNWPANTFFENASGGLGLAHRGLHSMMGGRPLQRSGWFNGP
ncbi:hypothetical protein ACFLQ2_00985 [archaeon]